MIRERRGDLAAFQRSADDIRRTCAKPPPCASPARWKSSCTPPSSTFSSISERHLFAIGYNVTEGRRDSTYYDALASEARLASFVAIAMRHVSQEHWFKLGRLMTPVGTHRALVSWSASMFEYFMPLLVMRSYPRTLLNETYQAVISRQIEYAKAAGMPWGISESAYNVQDAGANYQYRAFGVPGIGLKRGLADDLVDRAVRVSARGVASPKGSHRKSRASRIGGCARDRWGTTKPSTTPRSASSRGSAARSCAPTWRTITA